VTKMRKLTRSKRGISTIIATMVLVVVVVGLGAFLAVGGQNMVSSYFSQGAPSKDSLQFSPSYSWPVPTMGSSTLTVYVMNSGGTAIDGTKLTWNVAGSPVTAAGACTTNTAIAATTLCTIVLTVPTTGLVPGQPYTVTVMIGKASFQFQPVYGNTV
jgi:hypothetical protein